MVRESFKYKEVSDYRTAADTLYAICGMILLSFAKHECSTRDVIIRNFVARSAMSLKGIFALWDAADYQNSWVVHRALLDRMFHLRAIGEGDNFLSYDDWSFYEQYKAQSKLKSDPEFKHEAIGWIYDLTQAQKERAHALSDKKPSWRRPKAEVVAKNMGMTFLYSYGYDYASTHVHPMANDGEQDFFRITKITPPNEFPSNISVLSNSILAASILLQDALNFSSFKWRAIVFDIISEIRVSLKSDDDSYKNTFIRLAELFRLDNLGEKT